jgi:hypothetical protein
MQFQLVITCQSIEDAERVLATLKHGADPAVVKQVEGQIPFADPAGLSDAESPAKKHFPETTNTAAEKPKNPRGRPRRQVAEPLPESAAPEAEATATPEAEAQAPAQQTYTIDDVRAALKDVQAKYGTADMAKPLEILGKFGAGRVSEVKAADYAGFIAACKAA